MHLDFVFKVEEVMHWLTTRTLEREEFWREGQGFREGATDARKFTSRDVLLSSYPLLEVMHRYSSKYIAFINMISNSNYWTKKMHELPQSVPPRKKKNAP